MSNPCDRLLLLCYWEVLKDFNLMLCFIHCLSYPLQLVQRNKYLAPPCGLLRHWCAMARLSTLSIHPTVIVHGEHSKQSSNYDISIPMKMNLDNLRIETSNRWNRILEDPSDCPMHSTGPQQILGHGGFCFPLWWFLFFCFCFTMSLFGMPFFIIYPMVTILVPVPK